MTAISATPDSASPPSPTLRDDATVISLVGLAHGTSHFYHLIVAPLFPWLKVEFGLSYSELGLLMTVFFVISGVGQALSGFVVDRVGAHRVLYFGVATLGISALVLSQAQSYAMLIGGVLIAGLGNSIFHPADYTLLNKRVSPPRLGHAFSVHGITGNIGWAAAPIFLAGIATLWNWRAALVCAAMIPAVVLVLLYMHRELLRVPLPAVQAGSNKQGAVQAGADAHVLSFMRLPAVWMCFAFFMITALALGGIQSFSAPSLRSIYGISLAAATAGFTAYMLGAAGGMVWGGFIAAKASRHERTIAIAFAISGTLALVVASGVLPGMFAVALMGAVGFGAGVAGPSRDLLIRAAAPANATGRVYGVVYSGLDTGLALAPLLFGALMDANHPKWVFIGIGVFQCLAIVTALGVGERAAHRAATEQAA